MWHRDVQRWRKTDEEEMKGGPMELCSQAACGRNFFGERSDLYACVFGSVDVLTVSPCHTYNQTAE